MSSVMKIDRYVELSLNEKTKYMYMTRNVWDDEDESDLKVDRIFFQQVQDFEYLVVNIYNKSCEYNEIKLCLKARNEF